MLLKDLLLFSLVDFWTNSVLLPGFALCINSIGGEAEAFYIKYLLPGGSLSPFEVSHCTSIRTAQLPQFRLKIKRIFSEH